MPRFLQALKLIAGERAAKSVVVEEAPPSAVALLRDLVERYVPNSIKSSLAALLGDKSQSELIFLASIFLAILLFVIILPACETLLGDDDENDDGAEEEFKWSVPSSLRVYKPGFGVVELDTANVADMTASSSGSESSGRSSSSRSIGSSCSMETIEESEEEWQLEEEDENFPRTGGELAVQGLEGKTLFAEEGSTADKMKAITQEATTVCDREVSRRSQ